MEKSIRPTRYEFISFLAKFRGVLDLIDIDAFYNHFEQIGWKTSKGRYPKYWQLIVYPFMKYGMWKKYSEYADVLCSHR